MARIIARTPSKVRARVLPPRSASRPEPACTLPPPRSDYRQPSAAWWFSTLKWLGSLYLGYVGAPGIKLALAEAR